MRLNQFLAKNTALSRRTADSVIKAGRVSVNGILAQIGMEVTEHDKVSLDGKAVSLRSKNVSIVFHKPVGYICSRNGQGSNTIYDILPVKYHNLNPVGRLDKNSSGLLLLTNDGHLANRLTHPRYNKRKIYEIKIDKPLQPLHHQMINDFGIQLNDGTSKLLLEKLDDTDKHFRVSMSEGRNRQIRRTFDALGYMVKRLHRTNFGDYSLGHLAAGHVKEL